MALQRVHSHPQRCLVAERLEKAVKHVAVKHEINKQINILQLDVQHSIFAGGFSLLTFMLTVIFILPFLSFYSILLLVFRTDFVCNMLR